MQFWLATIKVSNALQATMTNEIGLHPQNKRLFLHSINMPQLLEIHHQKDSISKKNKVPRAGINMLSRQQACQVTIPITKCTKNLIST